MDIEVKIAMEQNPVDAGLTRVAPPSSFACPECHGVLLQILEGTALRFRCHTGHAYSLESLLSAVDDRIDEAMWNTIRALEEGGLLMGRAAEHLQTLDHAQDMQDRLRTRANELRTHSALLRTLVSAHDSSSREDNDTTALPGGLHREQSRQD
jgi:two-component system chemotaxis response regulator CheB